MSLRAKLIILFLSVALIPLLFVSTLTFHNYKQSLETTCLSNLQNTAAFKADKIDAYFAGLKGDIEIAQGFYNIKENLPVLIGLADDPNNPKAAASRNILNAQLQQMQSVSDMTDIMLANPQGKIVYANKAGHVLKDMSTGFDAERKAFIEGKSRVYFSDSYFDSAEDNRFEMLVTAPASDSNGAFIGVIAFEVDMATIYKVIEDVTGLGNTGEVLVGKKIGNQVVYINPLRHETQTTIPKKITLGDKFGGPIQQAVQGNTGAGQSIDYRGQSVIAAWRYIPSLDWGMVAKIDTDEAFAEAIKLKNLAFIILAMVIILSCITAFSIARSIAEPIKQLSEGAAIIGSGNLDYRIGTPLKDEVGQLSRAFDKMTHNLKQTTASRDELNREIAERKQAQEALVSAHRRLVLAQQSAGAGIWDWDIRTDTLEWSPELFRLFGLDPKEQPSFGLWQSVMHPQDCEQAQKRIEQAIQSQTSLDSEYRIFLPSGQVRWINALGSAVYDENGKPQRLSGICIDITERKEIERALWDSQRRYSSVFHTSPAGIFVTRMTDGLFLEANDAYLQIIGYSAEEIRERTSLELNLWVNQEDRKTITNLLRQQGRVDNREALFRCKNGEIANILFSAVLFEQAGETCILGAMMDVTDRKKTEEALRVSQEDLNRAQAVANIGSWRLDVQRNELTWSDENHHIFGIPKGNPMTYETFLSTIHPEDLDYVDTKWKACLRGENYDIEHRLIVDGKTKWVREKAYLELDKHGALLGGFGITQDISDRKKKEEELYRLNRTLKALRNSNQAIMQVKDESEYLDEVCKIIVRDCGHAMVWIGFAEDDEDRTVRPVASAGFEAGYLKTLNVTWADTEHGRGPTGTAIRTGKMSMCRNMQTDPAFEPWRQEAIKRGYASSIVFPLIENNKAFGAITIYSNEPAPFSDDEVKLLTELATDLAYGITAIRLRIEHAQAEEAVLISEVRYRRLFEAARDGILILDADSGQIVNVNPFIKDMLGYSQEEFLDKKIWEIGLFKNIAATKEAFLELQNKDYIRYENLPFETKDGRRIAVEFIGNVYLVDRKRVFQCNIRDITDRVQAEEAVLVSEVRYRRLFEAARDGILILNAQSGQIVDVNPFIKEMLGYSNEEFLDKKLWEIGLFKNIAASKEAFLQLQNKEYIRYENLPLETKDGRLIAVEFVSNVYPVDHQKVIQCNIRDITDRVRAEEALKKSRDELEIRVKERTHELAQTVNILENEVRDRVSAEKIAKTERKRFEDVLEMLPAYAILLTEDYHVAYANRTFRDWFGNDNGKKCYEFLFNRTQPCENCKTYTVLKTQKSHFWEWTGPNGHNYDIYDYPFTDTDGSPLIMEIGVDVTTHKKAQEAVRQGEERYRSLTVATTQLVWTTDDQGQVIADMPAWRVFTGQSIEDIQGSGWVNALHPEDRDRTTQVWAQSLQEKSLYQTEYRIRRHDGVYRYMSVRGVPVIEPDGSIREWVGTCTDITERKLAQEKQDVTKAMLELFVKNNSRKEYLDAVVQEIRNWSGCHSVGIRIRDNEQNIPYESSIGFDADFLAKENVLHLGRDNCTCMRTILEMPQPSAINLTTAGGSFYCNDSIQFSNGLSEQDKKEYRGNCVKCGFQSIAVIPIRYRDEVMGAIHITDLKKDMVSLSKIQFIETTIAPLVGEAAQRFNAETELDKYRLNLEELVRQRTLELEKANLQLQSEAIHRRQIAENLARSNKDLEQFAYVASHDLQEPLRAVSGFVELLKRNLQNLLDAKTTEYMNFTTDGTRRMQALINGLLEYSRVNAKGKNPKQTDSKAALDLAIAHLLTTIKESQAAVTADELPKVHVDAVQLTQLFQNLIGNAIKFHGQQPPRIHISATRQDHAWQFAVADNGIGIEPQYAERIFLIFQRLHTRNQYPGTGIGLAICKKIIERHGGKIWVESKSENGSTFYFTIPDRGQTNNENEQLQS